MANNTEIILRDLTSSPEFVHELLPAAERIALLYHLSYLSLANFPELERVVRQCALDTQLLFSSSATVLLKCVTTSDDVVSMLLPMLKLAVQNNNTALAVKTLEKARTWIHEIVERVKEIINRYEKHIQHLASCTSDVITEKNKAEDKKAEISTEMKHFEEEVTKLQKELQKNFVEMNRIEANIQEKNTELNSLEQKDFDLTMVAIFVPIIGPVIKYIHDISAIPKIHVLTNELSQLFFEKPDLRKKEWKVLKKLSNYQRKLIKLKLEDGTIPDPVYLGYVQQCLSRIQQVLIQLQNFWESVSELLESLQKKTFVGENILEDNNMDEETKNYFLESIDNADKYWESFGQGCRKAKSIFSLQTKDAYKFLEFVPPPGSEEWTQQYESVMERLNNISPDPFCAQEPEIAEITE